MRNIAKCKLCNSIIESFHRYDYVTCNCGEIFIEGGMDYFKCGANNFENFLRIDNEGNEIIPKVIEKEEIQKNNDIENNKKPDKKELLKLFETMISNIESLPLPAMSTPITHYDLLSALMLILSLFKTDLKD